MKKLMADETRDESLTQQIPIQNEDSSTTSTAIEGDQVAPRSIIELVRDWGCVH